MTKKEQSERFIEAARELGVDQSGEAFESSLKRIMRSIPIGARKGSQQS